MFSGRRMGGRGLREISVTTQFQGTLFHDEMIVEYRMACQRVLEIPACFVSIDMMTPKGAFQYYVIMILGF